MGVQPVIPLRVYEDMEAAQRFLVDVFGFKQGRLVRDPSGRPFHAEVHTGDSVIWIHRVDPEHGLVPSSAARRSRCLRRRCRRSLSSCQKCWSHDRFSADGPAVRPTRVFGSRPRGKPLVLRNTTTSRSSTLTSVVDPLRASISATPFSSFCRKITYD
jgi:hypothetical protein